jgi:hypothetical protein
MHYSITEALYHKVMEGFRDAFVSFMKDVEVKFEAEMCI